MQQMISQRFAAMLLAGSTALGASLFAPAALAGSYDAFEPGFLRQAERALRRGEPARALEVLARREQGLKSRQEAEALGMSCRARLQLEELRAARRDCRAAVELDQSRASWRFLNNLGVAELGLGNFGAAEAAFAEAAALSGSVRTPRKNLHIVQQLRETGAATEQLAVEMR